LYIVRSKYLSLSLSHTHDFQPALSLAGPSLIGYEWRHLEMSGERSPTVNDYARGALEALAWALGLIEEGLDIAHLRRQLEGARDDLLRGITLDFRVRLKPR